MSMSKKDFIALADAIRQHNQIARSWGQNIPQPTTAFTDDQIDNLADFCAKQNPRFMRDRWLAYIAGECGPNGGAVKAKSLEEKVNAKMRKLADAISHSS